ncbi:MAG TPA: cobalt-precorrin-5B (C(1))-methyltransferase [Methanoregulaceae archaeon]|nr:cobalt-precorrin-5B (C(1))-methyltransferase [Methanoregulaceae archaeon]
MIDPVSGTPYPDIWVAACASPDDLALAASGLGVLTADGTVRRRGISTGTTAAAAAKAAVLSLAGPCMEVVLRLPCGIKIRVPVEAADGAARCRKDPGDYPDDATADAMIVARAVPAPETAIIAGEGIGRYVRDTTRFRRGEPAISEAARAAILEGVGEACGKLGLAGAAVTLAVPGGEVIATRTLNERVGIKGGISLLGTTGLVEPWDDHLEESVLARVAAADRVVLTTGRIGLGHARRRYPDADAVLVGGRICEAIAAAPGEVTLFGLPALILKYLLPDILAGTGCATVEEFATTPAFPPAVARAFGAAAARYPGLHIVLIDRSGAVIAEGP